MTEPTDTQCQHGIAFIGAKCIDCDRDVALLFRDQAQRDLAHWSRRVAEMDVAIAERVKVCP